MSTAMRDMKNMTELDYVIDCIEEDLAKLGIVAKVYPVRNKNPLIVFKSQADMHWYKLSGKYKEGDYISRRNYDYIEFRYGWKARLMAMLGIIPPKPRSDKPPYGFK